MVVMTPKVTLRVCAFRKRLMSISSPAVNISISLPRSPKNCTIGWFTPATSRTYGPRRTPQASRTTSSGIRARRASAGAPAMIAMTIANFARFGRARACDLNASSHSIVVCSTSDAALRTPPPARGHFAHAASGQKTVALPRSPLKLRRLKQNCPACCRMCRGEKGGAPNVPRCRAILWVTGKPATAEGSVLFKGQRHQSISEARPTLHAGRALPRARDPASASNRLRSVSTPLALNVLLLSAADSVSTISRNRTDDNILHRSKENILHRSKENILHRSKENILHRSKGNILHTNMDIRSKHVDRLDDKPGERAFGRVHNSTAHNLVELVWSPTSHSTVRRFGMGSLSQRRPRWRDLTSWTFSSYDLFN